MIFAGGQINVTNDISINIQNIKELIDYTAAVEADFCSMPEYAMSGFIDNWIDWEDKKPQVEAGVEELVAYATSKNVGMFLSTLYDPDPFEEDYFDEPEDNKVRNQVRVYDKDGKLLGAANKIRAWGPIEQRTVSMEGIKQNVITMPNNEKVGVMLCNDLWGNGFEGGPVIHRTMLADFGAQIFIHATNAERGKGRLKDDTLREFHNGWLRTVSLDGPIITTDNACNMNGQPYNGPTSSSSGICMNAMWVERCADRGVEFFHQQIGNVEYGSTPEVLQNAAQWKMQ